MPGGLLREDYAPWFWRIARTIVRAAQINVIAPVARGESVKRWIGDMMRLRVAWLMPVLPCGRTGETRYGNMGQERKQGNGSHGGGNPADLAGLPATLRALWLEVVGVGLDSPLYEMKIEPRLLGRGRWIRISEYGRVVYADRFPDDRLLQAVRSLSGLVAHGTSPDAWRDIVRAEVYVLAP